MTATPHNGKEEDFQLFLSLLDSDRFYGQFRDGVHKVDASDLMRRMVKEELVKFDGTPLFPERRASTVNYTAVGARSGLYEAVTDYVQTEMDQADALKAGKGWSASRSTLPAAAGLQSRGDLPVAQAARERLPTACATRSSAAAAKESLAETLDADPEDDEDLAPRSRRRSRRRWWTRPPRPRPSPSCRPRSACSRALVQQAGRRDVEPGSQVGGALEDPPEGPTGNSPRPSASACRGSFPPSTSIH